MPMTNLLSLFLGAVLATNPVEAASNLLTGKAVSAPAGVAVDPVEEAYQKILEFDDSSDTDIEKWIADAAKFAEAGAGADSATLKAKVEQRIAEVDKAYRTFVEQHPNHARARIAYGSYLNDNRDEPGAVKQWEEAKRIDPKLPAVWNNLANYYGHRGPVTNAFVHYQKAMDLMPNEAIYPWNYATTVYLFRKDAMEFFSISESDVFERALGLYRLAIKLDPANFIIRSDYANSFYGTKPQRFAEGFVAWQEALEVARDDVEREGVQIHLARCKLSIGQFEEAGRHLGLATNKMYSEIRDRMARRIERLKSGEEKLPVNRPQLPAIVPDEAKK